MGVPEVGSARAAEGAQRGMLIEDDGRATEVREPNCLASIAGIDECEM